MVEQLRRDPRIQTGADLLETSFEDLRTVVQDRLRQNVRPAPEGRVPACAGCPQLYVIYDQRDTSEASSWADFLFEQGLEIIRTVFEGDEAEVREYHEESLCSCDGALILWGAGSECWLRRKLRELQKSAGYGRSKASPVVGIALIPPKTPEKERFRTHEALIISQLSNPSTDALHPFISRLKS